MDNKDNFDLEEFEKKMKQLPKVEDHRSKNEIFQNIKKQLDTEPQKKRRSWMMPALASATAAGLLLALIPMILSNGSEEALPYAEEAEAGEMFMVDMDEALEKATETTMEYNNYIPAIVEGNLQDDQRVVTIPYLDEQAMFIVPLSFIVRDDDIILNQISVILEEYDPSAVGLLASPLKGVAMKEVSETTVSVDIPEVLAGSSNQKMLEEALNMVLAPLGYEAFNILVGGQGGVDIGEYGPMEGWPITSSPSGYTAYENSTGRTFLVAGGLGEVTGLTFEDIVRLMASTTPGIVIEAVEELSNQAVTISFGQETDLVIHEDSLMLLEAILLTAKHFKVEEVEFHNAGVDELGPYKFNDRISTEISPNGIAFR
ncbi:hypothetical protein [Alkalihalobacterium sp. APHAB7]|uniref:hypothetical protein n=1 Tax=Alkalihalobacterium sp. APHAB7 TaxID=3402081 RepID=UPI003AADC20B